MGLQLPIKASRPSCEALLLSPSTGATILNCRHSQQRRSSIVLHTDRRFASRKTACPGYPHTLPPLRGAGALRRNVRVPACGKGETPSPVPSPHGDSHHGPLHGEIRKMSGTRLPTGYRHDCPRPREGAGEEREARAGWGCRRGTYEYPPAGRGEPPPRSPPPVAIATTVQCTGTSLEELGPGLLSLSSRKLTSAPLPRHGFPPDIASTAPFQWRGEEAEGRAGRGLPVKRMDIPSV